MQQKTGKLRTRFRQNRPAKFIRVIFWITLLLFVSSIVSIWLNDDQQVKSRMVFNAVSCFFMLVLLVLPIFVKKFFNIRIPHVILVIYVIFAFSGIILGDVINFYDKFKYWDSSLGFFIGHTACVSRIYTYQHAEQSGFCFFKAKSPICFGLRFLLCACTGSDMGNNRIRLR